MTALRNNVWGGGNGLRRRSSVVTAGPMVVCRLMVLWHIFIDNYMWIIFDLRNLMQTCIHAFTFHQVESLNTLGNIPETKFGKKTATLSTYFKVFSDESLI